MDRTDGLCRANTLDDKTDRVGESARVVRGVAWVEVRERRKGLAVGSSARETLASRSSGRTWQQEHLALLDPDVLEDPIVNHLENHVALVLVEPFLRTGECEVKSQLEAGGRRRLAGEHEEQSTNLSLVQVVFRRVGQQEGRVSTFWSVSIRSTLGGTRGMG